MPNEYDCNTHSQCKLVTSATPTSNLTPPSYPAVFSLPSKKKVIQLPVGSDLSMINTSLLPHQKLDYLFSGIKKYPMYNLPVTFGPPHPLDPLSPPGT
ncbi:hypothetical protein O181_044809 [Austropuccinia psidii MF-1]|uniref:Uncharacterized protein n=1 Tax=Austropuccinia psidii MF-1 TaxID=1389203 RepID=A0A9Q3DKZ1_9BASI|nr:hypothetical protein [Austropuccinia psidii MF-1]